MGDNVRNGEQQMSSGSKGTIQLSDGVGGFISSSQINSIISNGYGSSNVNINAGLGNILLNSSNVNITGLGGILLNSSNVNIDAGLGNILLNSPNINSYNYAIPICFEAIQIEDTFSYTEGAQVYQTVFIGNFDIPYNFFVDTPTDGYTSTIWRINFDMNCYDSTINYDKDGIAMYIEFEDQAASIYAPGIYGKYTPFCKKSSYNDYSGITHSNFQTFNWCDYVDFSGLSGTGNLNLPLKINLIVASNPTYNTKFIWKVSLTRTNLV